jgi:hypothetical protein
VYEEGGEGTKSVTTGKTGSGSFHAIGRVEREVGGV